MAMIETWFNQDLQNPVHVQYLDGNVFSQDNLGNLIGVHVFDDGEPAVLSGSVSGNVIRQDGGTVAVTGTLSGNDCYIILPAAAYSTPGPISVIIKLTGGGSTTTLCAIVANVYQASTDTPVDPGTIIPDIAALIATINAAILSIPSDYDALVKDVQAINDEINGRVFNYSVDSVSGWVEKIIVPGISLKKDDFVTIEADFTPAVSSSTYIYLNNGDTQISYTQVNGLSSKVITYKATADISQFRVTTNSQSYTGKINVKLTKSSEQTQVEENRITAHELAKEKYGYISLQRLSNFVRGGYDYPNFNYNSFQVSSGVITAPFPLFILIGSGYKATAAIIGDTVTSTGWQTHSIYIPAGANFVIKIEKVSHGSDEFADIETYIDALTVYNDESFPWHNIVDYADSFQHSGHIMYSTGLVTSASGYFEILYFKNPRFRFIKLHASVYARDLAEIAFYSTEEISSEGYIQSASQYAGSWDENHYIYAEVPANAKLVCVCSRNQLTSGDPFNVEVFVDNPDQYKNVELIHRTPGLNAFEGYKYIYHFNANRLGESEIPSQSLFDIDIARRLGFRMYELNVHKTATPGVYVCVHGTSGKIGNELVARDGTTDISNYRFEDVTAQAFLEDYVYNTENPQYRTHVTFLEEGLALCKKYNMIPLVTWADYGAIEYFEKYTSGRYILNIYDKYYIRRSNFKGAYCLYQSLTAEQLSEVLDKSGAPLFYSITNAESTLTDSELKDLAELCHSKGSFIGSAGVYQGTAKNMKLFDLGFDFMSSGWEVEFFTNGNAISANSDGNFDAFTHDGTVSGETLVLSDGQGISVSPYGDSAPMVSKGALTIRFSGTIIFNMGPYIDDISITSDGSKDIVLTTAFFREQPIFSATADGAVNVYSCIYDASIC